MDEIVPATASLFSPSNLGALLTHLPTGSMSKEIVTALQETTTQAEARTAIQVITRRTIDEERAKLGGKTSST